MKKRRAIDNTNYNIVHDSILERKWKAFKRALSLDIFKLRETSAKARVHFF